MIACMAHWPEFVRLEGGKVKMVRIRALDFSSHVCKERGHEATHTL